MSSEDSVSQESPEVGHEHPDVTGGWLRPAVFGAMDGLVSNLALIAGVAGGTRGSTSSHAVVLAGLAGLAAGAFSMAAGEYTSVASQSEAAAREIERERAEIERHPQSEIRELALMYTEKGIDEDLAMQVAEQVHRDVDNAVAVHAREELGVDPNDLPSPTLAAVSSFVSFGLGALVPLLPYLLGANSLLPGLGITLLALFICGAVVTNLTNRSWFFGGVRQLVLGAVAAGLTYAVGAAFGAGIG